MFGYLKRAQCGQFCGCAAWRRNEIHRFKSPYADHNNRYPTISCASVDDYWRWFFAASAGSSSRSFFDDFCITGCWNWLLDIPEVEEFQELFMRYDAAKAFGIRPAESFDSAPVVLLQRLLLINRELELAKAEKIKRDGTRKNTRIQH